MSTHNIIIKDTPTVRLPTAGKYCDRDIIVAVEPVERARTTIGAMGVDEGQLWIRATNDQKTGYVTETDWKESADGYVELEIDMNKKKAKAYLASNSSIFIEKDISAATPATCTIVINTSSYGQQVDVGYTNGGGVGSHVRQTSNITISNVMCGSMFTIIGSGDMVFGSAPSVLKQGRNWAICKAPTASSTYTYSLVDDS